MSRMYSKPLIYFNLSKTKPAYVFENKLSDPIILPKGSEIN